MPNIKKITSQKEYDFLRTKEYLKDNILFLAFGGSYAYGTSNADSDVDIRGCMLNRYSDLIGMTSTEQYIDDKTDTLIYAFNKLISLLINCNPNTIEMLGCRPEHYLFFDGIGKELIANAHIFLSQRCTSSFGGYANQQLNRLKNAVARDAMPQAEKEGHITRSINHAMLSFHDRYSEIPEGAIKLFVDKSDKHDLDAEIFMDISLTHYPLRDWTGMWSEMQEIAKRYGKLNHRNNKKDENHLDKHAMHLIRLYLMVIDILKKGEINTYREDDLDFLQSIRKGYYRNGDGTYKAEFFKLVDHYEQLTKEAAKTTGLSKEPDMQKISAFVESVNERVIERWKSK